MSFRTWDRSTTDNYGNHDPYVTQSPRTKGWRSFGIVLAGPVLLGVVGLFSGSILFGDTDALGENTWSDIRNFELSWSGSDIETIEYTPRPPIEPGVLAAGDSFEVPCDDGVGTCMTITLSDVDADFRCSTETGRLVALTLNAKMPADAPEDFQNPFQFPDWIAVTGGQSASKTLPMSECGSGLIDELALSNLSPGATITATLALPIPGDTAGVHLVSFGEALFSIPLAVP